MIKRIENENLIAEINETGAELFSLKSKKTGTEYLWQGKAEYWAGRSPVLFPICGRLYHGKYTYSGKEYEMPIHGIAKKSVFISDKISENEIDFTLKSNEETKKSYPFAFEFKIKYSLNKNALAVTYFIKNCGDKVMPFSFGAHPGFNVPFIKGEKFEDYYIEFSTDELKKLVLSENYLYTDAKRVYRLKDKKLELKHEIFDEDALFFEMNTDTVSLKSKKSDTYIAVSFSDMTCLGLWHAQKSDAPYVCIEPWHGVPATEGETDDLLTKKQTLTLNPLNSYENTYFIKISEK